MGDIQIGPVQSSPVGSRLTFGTDGTGWQFRIAKNQAGAISDLVTVTDSGNVGIGNTAPTQAQVVIANGATSVPSNSSSTNGLVVGGYGTLANSAVGVYGSIRGVLNLGGNYTAGTSDIGNIKFSYAPLSTTDENAAAIASITAKNTATDSTSGGVLTLNTRTASGSLSERMRVDSNGNVGIGTTTPGVTLDVVGSIRASSNIYASNFSDGSGQFYSWSTPGGGLVLKTANTERMRIDNSGNVGVGTTAPSTKLQVAGEISPSADNSYSLGDASLRFTAVYAVNGTIQTSDARQKKDILESDLGLDFINRLRPVSYHWNTGVDSDLHYGLIAQETEKAINDSKDAAGTQKYPAESTIVIHDSASDRYGLKYSELIAPVIKGIQELYNKVTSVERNIASVKDQKADKTEIEALKAENAVLKARVDESDKENAKIKARLEQIEKALQSK